MKFIHTSDWYIGRQFHNVSLLDDQRHVLNHLQASGRMIGIISHISELKEQMALRLDVISSKNGSRIHMGSNSGCGK